MTIFDLSTAGVIFSHKPVGLCGGIIGSQPIVLLSQAHNATARVVVDWTWQLSQLEQFTAVVTGGACQGPLHALHWSERRWLAQHPAGFIADICGCCGEDCGILTNDFQVHVEIA